MIIAKCYSQQGQGDMFFSNDEGAGLTAHERLSERQIVKQKNRRIDVETHTSLGVHILISVRLNLFALLSTATHTQPAQELSNAQFGTPDRVLRRSCMSSYSLSLPASVAITWNSFGSVWTSSRYSAQPPTPNLHESSPMRSLVHPIGSCEGPA